LHLVGCNLELVATLTQSSSCGSVSTHHFTSFGCKQLLNKKGNGLIWLRTGAGGGHLWIG